MSHRSPNGPTHDAQRLVILLCSDLERQGHGLDLGEIRRSFVEAAAAPEVRVIPELCERPREVAKAVAASGAGRAVLGLCSRDYPEVELHTHARGAGIDPFALEAVNLGSYCARVHDRTRGTEKAKLLLEGAIAKARMSPGDLSQSVRPVLSSGEKMSRRAFFTLPPLHYEPVPSIREGNCAFREGCRVCEVSCLHAALSGSAEGRMVLDKSRCTGCGVCVSACPLTAIDFPGASPRQIDAQVRTLLDGASPFTGSRAVLFACERGTPALEAVARNGFSYAAGWLPVEVPCLGMVTPTWLLHCLNLGAAAVGVLPCLRSDCRFGRKDVATGRVDYCRKLLGLLGGSPDSVILLDPSDERGLADALAGFPRGVELPEVGHPESSALFGARATATTLLRLAERHASTPDALLEHPDSPVGMVHLEEGCTGCGACALACPSRALVMERQAGSVALTFDSGLCLACGECAPVCPETVVRVERVTDLRCIFQGKVALYHDSQVRCEACGAPVAPDAMLARISEMLGKGNAPLLSFISRYCASCRGSHFVAERGSLDGGDDGHNRGRSVEML